MEEEVEASWTSSHTRSRTETGEVEVEGNMQDSMLGALGPVGLDMKALATAGVVANAYRAGLM